MTSSINGEKIVRGNNSDGSIYSRLKTLNDEVSQQNPLPCDGDSVYSKDVWVEESITTNWTDTDNTGDELAYIPFNNLHTRLTNSTTDAEKTLLIHFNRTISAHQVGLGCFQTGNFSNVKIELLGSAGEVRSIIDESTDNTKHTSRDYPFNSQLFNAVRLTFYTTDPVCISNITIQKATNTQSQLQAESELTETLEPIKSYKNALKVDSALVHEKGVNLFFHRETGTTTTMAQEANINDISITVTDSIGFTIGDKIRLTTDVEVGQAFLTITNIVGNVITLDRPLSSHISAGSLVVGVSISLNVNGSLENPVIFKIAPPNSNLSLRWQLTRMLIAITSASAMDDGLFGSIPHLTNGLNLRLVKGDGTYRDLTNWKDNGDMAEDMYDIEYTNKAPSGQYGLRGRWTFTKAEFIVDLDGANGDYFELRVQNDLTDLSDFEIKCQGRLFGG